MAVDDFQNAIGNKKEEEEIKQEEFQESYCQVRVNSKTAVRFWAAVFLYIAQL